MRRVSETKRLVAIREKGCKIVAHDHDSEVLPEALRIETVLDASYLNLSVALVTLKRHRGTHFRDVVYTLPTYIALSCHFVLYWFRRRTW